MTGLLPAGMRCSALWYATARGLPTDIGYLKALGLIAYRMAAWEGLEPWQVPEGPWLVFMWPERIWDAASQGLVRQEASIAGYMRQLDRYDDFWRYPAPPEDTQAYADWCAMAAEKPGSEAAWYEDRDVGRGPGQEPWDGDDIRPW